MKSDVGALLEVVGGVGEPATDELAFAPARGAGDLMAAAVFGGEQGRGALEEIAEAGDLVVVEGQPWIAVVGLVAGEDAAGRWGAAPLLLVVVGDERGHSGAALGLQEPERLAGGEDQVRVVHEAVDPGGGESFGHDGVESFGPGV